MPTTHTLSFTREYGVRSYEPQPDGFIPITSICDHLQDIASRHADSLGFGLADLEKSGHLWLLARLHVMMDRLPRFGDTVSVTTWPSGNERLTASRDFLISDPSGVIGRATTSWVTMNKATHRPDSPDTVLNKRFIPERERASVFPSRAISRLKVGDHEIGITARRADMDINGHVNNVNYARFCLEAVPEAWDKAHRCMGIDIQFRTESFPGEQYTSYCSESDVIEESPTLLHGLVRKADTAEIVRMRSWWFAKS